MPRIGFDTDTYLAEQTRSIVERRERLGKKLYLEFGGKLAFDYHAARVLPGFDPNVKIRLLEGLADRAEILVCIYADAIARKRIRAGFAIVDDEVVREAARQEVIRRYFRYSCEYAVGLVEREDA